MNERENDDFKYMLGEYFRKQRLSKNYTQDDIAHALNISIRWVQKFEKGEINITLANYIQIAELLEVPYSVTDCLFKRYSYQSYQERVIELTERKIKKKK